MQVTTHYQVLLIPSEEGYAVGCPGLPGCWSQGETEDEALANIAEAIREYLAAVYDEFKDADLRQIEVAIQECHAFRAFITGGR